MVKKQYIHIESNEISVLAQGNEDYISLTDMAHSQMQEHIIFRWMSLKGTIEYIGEWEALYNPNFNYTEFGTIKNASLRFSLFPFLKYVLPKNGCSRDFI